MYKVFALADSIGETAPNTLLHVLCTDKNDISESHTQCRFYKLTDLKDVPCFDAISTKYKRQSDRLRWSLKPIFLHYLLQVESDKVIYVDNDIYFEGKSTFLFDLLSEHSFLLTPHHYPRNPNKDQNWLEANYKVGLYNAGFVGVNLKAKEHLIWWAECCAYRCEKNPLRGTFDDQKYLDLIPIIAEDALVLKHKGCNVAEWNRIQIKRTRRSDGTIWLDEIYPLIFIHFNHTTVKVILSGGEPYLQESLKRYMSNLKKYRPDIEPGKMIKPDKLIDKIKYYIWKKATEFNF